MGTGVLAGNSCVSLRVWRRIFHYADLMAKLMAVWYSESSISPKDTLANLHVTPVPSHEVFQNFRGWVKITLQVYAELKLATYTAIGATLTCHTIAMSTKSQIMQNTKHRQSGAKLPVDVWLALRCVPHGHTVLRVQGVNLSALQQYNSLFLNSRHCTAWLDTEYVMPKGGAVKQCTGPSKCVALEVELCQNTNFSLH